MLYFDTSFLTPAFRKEATSSSIELFLQRQNVGDLAISHWVRIEFTSILARDVRMGLMETETAIDLDRQFEIAVEKTFNVILPDVNDFDLCKRYLQYFQAGLRAGDAMHLAVAANHGAEKFYTLDKKLLRAGKLLGLPVAAGIHGRE
jgi:predicted nucleic acid-binding protein